jgi:type I restriction enzyme S subunit
MPLDRNSMWGKAKLGDVAKVISGFAFKSKSFQSQGVPVLKIKNIRIGSIDLSDVDCVEPSFLSLDRKYHVEVGHLLISLTGSHLTQPNSVVGRVAVHRNGQKRCLLNQRAGKINITQPDLCDSLYLFYFLSTTKMRREIALMASGAASQANVSPSQVESIEILLPPLSTQRKIASVLSAYDDLIENSTCRIEILEEMAQRIYREWFVHFRFPGHEKVEMVESELGPIPEGWEVKKASDALLINPKTKVPKEGEKPFVPMGSLSNNSMLISGIEPRSGNSGSKFRNGDTLFARITPSLENGKTGYVQFLPAQNDVAFGSTEFIVLRSRTLCSEYVYLLSRSNEFRDNAIKSMTGASGRQRVQEQCFDNFLLAHPDPETLETFSDLISPLFHNVYVLARKNENLRLTRNLLLPKLISGEVSVENLDVEPEEVSEATFVK